MQELLSGPIKIAFRDFNPIERFFIDYVPSWDTGCGVFFKAWLLLITDEQFFSKTGESWASSRGVSDLGGIIFVLIRRSLCQQIVQSIGPMDFSAESMTGRG